MSRLVKHLDDKALGALTDFYSRVFPQVLRASQVSEVGQDREFAALDMCSSWVSHYPAKPKAKRLAITGMNAEELKLGGMTQTRLT